MNLLPEAAARIHIVRDLKIVDNDFDLLRAIGGECAGALSLLADDKHPSTAYNYTSLSDETLKRLLLHKGHVTSFVNEEDRPRLSLAGAQDKCPIYYHDEQFYLPHDAAPSTHIMKFEVTDYRNIPTYEYFLTSLASKLGLPVVECSFEHLDRHYFLLIKRFDRLMAHDNKITRLHQEDFCQALGIGYEKKYQADGGPSFTDCYKLIQDVSTQPLLDSENLLKWQIFNVLAGNSDGHAKNLALIYDENQNIKLAPFYDLVCTRAILRANANLALSVGDCFNPNTLSIHDWESLAEACDIKPAFINKTVGNLAQDLLDSYDEVNAAFEAQYGSYSALQRVKRVVVKQCQRTLKLLGN